MGPLYYFLHFFFILFFISSLFFLTKYFYFYLFFIHFVFIILFLSFLPNRTFDYFLVDLELEINLLKYWISLKELILFFNKLILFYDIIIYESYHTVIKLIIFLQYLYYKWREFKWWLIKVFVFLLAIDYKGTFVQNLALLATQNFYIYRLVFVSLVLIC